MSDYFTKKVICGACGKSRTIRGNVQMHQSRTNWEAFIRKNGVSPCPCRLQNAEGVYTRATFARPALAEEGAK